MTIRARFDYTLSPEECRLLSFLPSVIGLAGILSEHEQRGIGTLSEQRTLTLRQAVVLRDVASRIREEALSQSNAPDVMFGVGGLLAPNLSLHEHANNMRSLRAQHFEQACNACGILCDIEARFESVEHWFESYPGRVEVVPS